MGINQMKEYVRDDFKVKALDKSSKDKIIN
jgi:hypothetical protein